MQILNRSHFYQYTIFFLSPKFGHRRDIRTYARKTAVDPTRVPLRYCILCNTYNFSPKRGFVSIDIKRCLRKNERKRCLGLLYFENKSYHDLLNLVFRNKGRFTQVSLKANPLLEWNTTNTSHIAL